MSMLFEVKGRQYKLVPVDEDTKKVDGGYENIGAEGKHSKEPLSKEDADNQRKAMFANGYHENNKYKSEPKCKKIKGSGTKNDLKGGSKKPDEDPKLKSNEIKPGEKKAFGSCKPGYGPSKVGKKDKDPKDPKQVKEGLNKIDLNQKRSHISKQEIYNFLEKIREFVDHHLDNEGAYLADEIDDFLERIRDSI
jgi:hypothetical protein